VELIADKVMIATKKHLNGTSRKTGEPYSFNIVKLMDSEDGTDLEVKAEKEIYDQLEVFSLGMAVLDMEIGRNGTAYINLTGWQSAEPKAK
jgi:hypothetical protein